MVMTVGGLAFRLLFLLTFLIFLIFFDCDGVEFV